MPPLSLFQRLKKRKIVQWTVAYLAGAWLALEAFDLVAEQFQWAMWVRQGATVALLFGLLVTQVLAWNHGERGRQRASGGELILVTLLLAMAGTSVVFLRSRSHQQATLDAAAMSFGFHRGTPPERSVAVLPCTDMSQAGDQEYFADGLADELTTRLNMIRDLRVAARTSAFSYKNSGEGTETIASALNVRNVLECSVRKEGNQVRITAQLVDAEEGFQRWGESYDSDLGNILALQGEIALAIASALEAELAGEERTRLVSRGTENQKAYDLYLRGLSSQLKQPWTPENQFRALEYFQAAVSADSTFAKAWAFLATTYIGLGNLYVLPPEEAYSQAEIAANRAAALDDELSHVHWALGWVKLSYTYDWKGAEEEFRRTIALAPSDFTGYHSLNFALSVFGRFDEAMAAAEEAIFLDPLAVWPRFGLFELRYKMGDFAGIIADSEAALDLEPDDVMRLSELGFALAHLGVVDEAVSAAARAESLSPGDPTITLFAANTYAIVGDRAAARERLERMEAAAEEGNALVSAGMVALVYASLGDADGAFEWLGRAVDEYDSMVFSLHYPELRPLRTDPRFGALLDRLGLPREAYE
jgi:adenylate cyclase